MKKILLTFLFSVIAFYSFGQSESAHFTFKGVPIDGTKQSVIDQLKQKGFHADSDEPDILWGPFAGYSNCKIIVTSDEARDLVWCVGVVFQSTDDFNNLKSQYNHLKNLLTEKYGTPIEDIEEFENSYSTLNTLKMYALLTGRGTISCSFRGTNGIIQLFIKGVLRRECEIFMVYSDIQNVLIVEQNASDDL